MIVEELAARFGFDVVGMEKVRRAIEVFQRLSRAIAMFAATVAKRLAAVGVHAGRMTRLLLRSSVAAAGFGTAFVASSAVITAAAATMTAALAGVAAGFAKLRKTTIDSAFVNGVPVAELGLMENLMNRVGASVKDGRKFIGEFVEKFREGVKEGGDWTDTLKKQGVSLKTGGKQVKTYSRVLEDVLKASDKIKDGDKKREFLKEALPGAPDQFLASLLQSVSAFEQYKKLVLETRKAGGKISGGDILNVGDITDAMGKFQTTMQGFVDSFGSGLMASFATNFRELGNAILAVANDENREKVRKFAGDLADFSKSVYRGGWTVLTTVGEAISSITSALGKVDDATGGKLGQIATGLAALGAALALVAGAPVVALSAAITGLLYSVAKFQEWKAGGDTALNDFFDTMAKAAEGAKKAVDGLMASIKSLLGLDTPEEQATRKATAQSERDTEFSRMKDFNDTTKTPAQLEQYRRSNPGYADWERRQAAEKPQALAEPAKAGAPGAPGLPADPAKAAKPGLPGNAGAPAEAPTLPSRRDGEPESRRRPLIEGYRQSDNVEDRRKPDAASAPEVKVPPGIFDGVVKALHMLFSKQAEISPERQVQKIAQDREVTKTENDQRTYTDIGNDKSSTSVTIHQVLQQDAAAVAAAAKSAVLGAISTKGGNTSTGALTAP